MNIWMVHRINNNGQILYYPSDFYGGMSVFRPTSNNKIFDLANHLYNKKNEMMSQAYHMTDIYPVSVGDLRYDDDEVDSLQIFDVTFYTNKLKLFDKEL